MNNLFLICPDCYIEQAVRNNYGDDSFFLTALGAVFEMDKMEYAEEVNQFIISEDVGSIYIVNDIYCTFIQNPLTGNREYNTKAEKVIQSIIKRNERDISSIIELKGKAKKIAALNIRRQALELLDVPFIGDKIRDFRLKIFGLIYDRVSKEFEEFRIKL